MSPEWHSRTPMVFMLDCEYDRVSVWCRGMIVYGSMYGMCSMGVWVVLWVWWCVSTRV